VLVINNIEMILSYNYDNYELSRKLHDWFLNEMNKYAPATTKNAKINFMENFSDLIVVLITKKPMSIDDTLLTKLDIDGVYFDYPNEITTKNLIV